MSAELRDYLYVIGESIFDFVVGYASGAIIDIPFNRSDLRPIGSMEQFWKVLSLVFLQVGVTGTAMMGLRKLMYANDGENVLTGGMFFMFALMISEGGLILNARALWEYLYGLVKQPSPNIMSANDDAEEN